MVLVGIVYVVTCGRCGRTSQRTSVCGHRGRLSIRAVPGPAPSAARRVEAWLFG